MHGRALGVRDLGEFPSSPKARLSFITDTLGAETLLRTLKPEEPDKSRTLHPHWMPRVAPSSSCAKAVAPTCRAPRLTSVIGNARGVPALSSR